MIGLYVHIPFCARKCGYCDFVTAPSGGGARHGAFLGALEAEIAARAGAFAGRRFETLYAGGGTPSQLSPAETRRLFTALRAAFAFREGAEVTWEMNPADADPARLAALKRAAGVTRVSLGVQSFDDAVLARLGRDHDAARAAAAFEALRRAGFTNVSVDLMLALPGQTPESARRTVERAIALGPEHVSLYELVVEPRTPFAAERRQGRLPLPGEDEALEMLLDARRAFAAAGYRQYELLSYARPGFESRHNRLYWDNAEHVGLGPGAYSYECGRRFRIAASLEEYLAKAARGDWSAHDEETLGAEAREVESLLLALRLDEGADAARFAGALSRLSAPVGALREEGLLAEEHGWLRLTERGRRFAESVFAELARPSGSAVVQSGKR